MFVAVVETGAIASSASPDIKKAGSRRRRPGQLPAFLQLLFQLWRIFAIAGCSSSLMASMIMSASSASCRDLAKTAGQIAGARGAGAAGGRLLLSNTCFAVGVRTWFCIGMEIGPVLGAFTRIFLPFK